jgi:hypothetical protein
LAERLGLPIADGEVVALDGPPDPPRHRPSNPRSNGCPRTAR